MDEATDTEEMKNIQEDEKNIWIKGSKIIDDKEEKNADEIQRRYTSYWSIDSHYSEVQKYCLLQR